MFAVEGNIIPQGLPLEWVTKSEQEEKRGRKWASLAISAPERGLGIGGAPKGGLQA